MERRLSAILAADVVGYSRLIETDEAGHASSPVDMIDASSVDVAWPLPRVSSPQSPKRPFGAHSIVPASRCNERNIMSKGD